MLELDADGRVVSPGELLWARRDSDVDAFIEDGGHTWTWRATANAAAMIADKLGSLDGSRVAVTAPNGGGLVAGMFAVWFAGGVPSLVSPKLPGPERDAVIASLAATATVGIDVPNLDADMTLSSDELLSAPQAADRVSASMSLSDDGVVLCTSGTTGRPKAIVQSVRGVWGMVDSVTRHVVDPANLPVPKHGRPRRIEPKPMVHIGSMFGLLLDMWRGRSVVIMQRFDAHRYAELVHEYQINTISLVPSMLRMLIDAQVGPLRPPVTIGTTGTTALPDALRDEFEATFGVPLQATYGQTESCGPISYEPVDDVLTGTRREGSSGRVVPNIDVQIRDDEGRLLPPRTEGAIWVSGPAIRPNVVGDSEQLLVDGWLDTGDSGWLDEDRYIYITGRRRELIIRGGLKVVPAEVEHVLTQHPFVSEAAVVGRPNTRLGEVPVAWVRPAARARLDVDELLAFLRARLAAYKVPVAVHVVSEFPRTDTGKVRKVDLWSPDEVRPAVEG